MMTFECIAPFPNIDIVTVSPQKRARWSITVFRGIAEPKKCATRVRIQITRFKTFKLIIHLHTLHVETASMHHCL